MHVGEKPYYCDIWDKLLPLKLDLVAHRQMRAYYKTYHWNSYGEWFAKMSTLVSHHGIHTSENAFKRTICPNSIAWLRKLRLHMKACIHLRAATNVSCVPIHGRHHQLFKASTHAERRGQWACQKKKTRSLIQALYLWAATFLKIRRHTTWHPNVDAFTIPWLHFHSRVKCTSNRSHTKQSLMIDHGWILVLNLYVLLVCWDFYTFNKRHTSS